MDVDIPMDLAPKDRSPRLAKKRDPEAARKTREEKAAEKTGRMDGAKNGKGHPGN